MRPQTVATAEDVRLELADVRRFWVVVDAVDARTASDADFTAALERGYIAAASPGLRDFIAARRLKSAAELAAAYERSREYYDLVRANTLGIDAQAPAIREQLRRFVAIVPGAVLPATAYFVIGSLNTEGTQSNHGLLIGAEMVSLPEDASARACEGTGWQCRTELKTPDYLPFIVVHELTHFNQAWHWRSRTVLTEALHEGVADFIASLVTGKPVGAPYSAFGARHDDEIMRRFALERSLPALDAWFYTVPFDRPWPRDMGYYAGYRIAAGYYAQARDKRAALRELLDARDPEALLARSGVLSASAP